MSFKSRIRSAFFRILGSRAIDNLRYLKFSKKYSRLLRKSKNREAFIDNFSRSYEIEMAVLPKLIKNPKNIVDVGANYGTYSLFFSKIYPSSKIFAFEPATSSYNIFRKLIKRFSLKNVFPIKKGLGEKEETKEIIFPKNYTIIAHIAGKNSKKNQEDGSESIAITTLDKFLTRNKISNIDLIKCDVEGFEFSVFKGAKEALKKHKPLVFVEIEQRHTEKYGVDAQDVLKFFKKMGYLSYAVQKETIRKAEKIMPDIPLYLFSPKKLQ